MFGTVSVEVTPSPPPLPPPQQIAVNNITLAQNLQHQEHVLLAWES